MEITSLIPKFVLKSKQPRLARVILKKNKVKELSLLNIKTNCKTAIIKTVKLAQR